MRPCSEYRPATRDAVVDQSGTTIAQVSFILEHGRPHVGDAVDSKRAVVSWEVCMNKNRGEACQAAAGHGWRGRRDAVDAVNTKKLS